MFQSVPVKGRGAAEVHVHESVHLHNNNNLLNNKRHMFPNESF